MVRFQTCLLALVVITAAFAGAAAADSPSLIGSVDSTEGDIDEENGDDEADDEESDDEVNGDDEADDEGSDDEANGDEENGGETNGDETNGDETNDDEGNGADEPAPAELRITDVETNTPITVGETIRVTLEVENVGEQAGSGDVWFDLDEYRKDEATVSLGPGESESVSLSYVSKSGDAADWSLNTETPHDTYTRTVTIEERDDDDEADEADEESSNGGSSSSSGGFTGSASFDIQSFNVTDAATVGDTITFNATVENTGTASEERLVWFTIDGSTVNETAVDLDRGSDRTMTYAYNTSDLENGTYEATVETPDGVETQEVELEPRRSELLVEAVDVTTTVDAGDHLDASVELHNAGNATATTNVTLLLDEHRIDTAPVSVAPNESTTVQLTYRTNAELTGDLDFVVDAEDTREPFAVTVAEPTPEPTPTPEPVDQSVDGSTPADSNTSTPEDATGSNETVPGFGVVPMVVALLLALTSLMARHRR